MLTNLEPGAVNRIKAMAVRYSPIGSEKEFCTTTCNLTKQSVTIPLIKRLALGTMLDIELFKYDTDLRARARGKVVELTPLEAVIRFTECELIAIEDLINRI